MRWYLPSWSIVSGQTLAGFGVTSATGATGATGPRVAELTGASSPAGAAEGRDAREAWEERRSGRRSAMARYRGDGLWHSCVRRGVTSCRPIRYAAARHASRHEALFPDG